MAKISELPQLANPAGTELVPVVGADGAITRFGPRVEPDDPQLVAAIESALADREALDTEGATALIEAALAHRDMLDTAGANALIEGYAYDASASTEDKLVFRRKQD